MILTWVFLSTKNKKGALIGAPSIQIFTFSR